MASKKNKKINNKTLKNKRKIKQNKTKRKKNRFSLLNLFNIFSSDTRSDTTSDTTNNLEIRKDESLYYKGIEPEYNKKNLSFHKLSKELIKRFHDIDTLKNTINPKNNFYGYVNKIWLKNIKIKKSQKYIVQFDDFRIVQDKVYHELLDIVDKYIKTETSNQAVQLKNLYYSVKNGASVKLFKETVKEMIHKLDNGRKDKNNLWTMIGKFNSNDLIAYSCPLSFNLNPDKKHSNIYRCYIESPKVTLVDVNVYFDDGTDIAYKDNYRKAYFEYLAKLFYVALGPNNNINVKDVFDVERDILYAMGYNDPSIKNSPDNYNKVTAKEAMTKYGLDWEKFSYELGFSYVPDFFITSNLIYLKYGTKLLMDNWTSEKWRAYWIYIPLRHMVRMTNEYSNIYYDFMGDFMYGASAKIDSSVLPIFGIGYAFNTFLTNQYIDHFERKETVEYLKHMASDLKEVFYKILHSNIWLQPKTQKYALFKLKRMKLLIGSPKNLMEDPDLSFDIDNTMSNMTKIGEWRHNKFLQLEGKEVIDFPTIDWSVVPPKLTGSQSYIVNAYYDILKNSIYVPLGYIQKPFIDLEERGIEYNLAHVGFTLGHEMSHGFDDLGSQYDYKGDLHDWWTAEDKKKFKEIQQNIIKQYKEFTSRDGIQYDSFMGVGENMADICGIRICNQYLAEFQEKNDDVYSVRKLSFQEFYLYYAYQMRQKLNKRAITAYIKTNPHALDKYRTNIPLSRLELFKKIYDVKKGDGMYWETDKHIW